MMNYGYEYGHGGFGGEIVMILFWVFIIAGIVFLVKNSINTNSPVSRSTKKTALTILEERYARGEIDTDDFESRRANLEK